MYVISHANVLDLLIIAQPKRRAVGETGHVAARKRYEEKGKRMAAKKINKSEYM